MDPTSIATSIVSTQAQSLQSTIGISIEKSNIDSQRQIAQLLATSVQTSAPLAPGVGTRLDVTA